MGEEEDGGEADGMSDEGCVGGAVGAFGGDGDCFLERAGVGGYVRA